MTPVDIIKFALVLVQVVAKGGCLKDLSGAGETNRSPRKHRLEVAIKLDTIGRQLTGAKLQTHITFSDRDVATDVKALTICGKS